MRSDGGVVRRGPNPNRRRHVANTRLEDDNVSHKKLPIVQDDKLRQTNIHGNRLAQRIQRIFGGRNWKKSSQWKDIYRKNRPKLRLGISAVVLLCFLVLGYLFFVSMNTTKGLSTERKHPISTRLENIRYRSSPKLDPVSGFSVPPKLGVDELDEQKAVDFGGIDLRLLEGEEASRVIFHDWWEDEGSVHDINSRDDDIDQYYAFDDDFERNTYKAYHGYDDDGVYNVEDGRCRRANWHRLHFPTCNVFHELDVGTNVPKYLSSGTYRDAFVVFQQVLEGTESLAWKHLAIGREYSYDNYEFIRMDALVSERLTSRPRIVHTYGLCGLSTLSEFIPGGDLEHIVVPSSGYMNQSDLEGDLDVKPQNNLPAHDKLLIALEMAKAIAELHGFPDGVIVHDDIQMSQFFRTKEGNIMLNDFNRAEIMLWDDERDAYCRYVNGGGNGNYRAPEEYADKPLDEKIDVYSLGNNIYALLTGLWPFYDTPDDHAVKKKIVAGETPFIDPRFRNRSYSEQQLVNVIESCWSYNPTDRSDIFRIVAALEGAVQKKS